MQFSPGCFWSPYNRLTFLSIFHWSPLAKSQKMADLGVFAKFVITRLYGNLRSRSLQQNAVLCLHFKCILIRRWCNLRQLCFCSPYSRPTFLRIFPLSPVDKISVNGRFWCVCQICHNSALRTLTERDFAKGEPRENAQKSRPTIGASKTPWLIASSPN